MSPEQSIRVPLEVLLQVTLITIHETSALTVWAFVVERRSVVLLLQIWILGERIWLRIVSARTVRATIIIVTACRRATEGVNWFGWHLHAWRWPLC